MPQESLPVTAAILGDHGELVTSFVRHLMAERKSRESTRGTARPVAPDT